MLGIFFFSTKSDLEKISYFFCTDNECLLKYYQYYSKKWDRRIEEMGVDSCHTQQKHTKKSIIAKKFMFYKKRE